MGDLGAIKKGTDKYINKIPGSPSLYGIQLIAFCGTAHFFKRSLLMWLKNITEKKQQPVTGISA